MEVEVIVEYDALVDELHIENSKGAEWRLFTHHPEIFLSSIIGATFGELFKNHFQNSRENELKFKLTFKEL